MDQRDTRLKNPLRTVERLMKLKNLIKDIPLEVRGSKEIHISGLCSHSRQVAPGTLFVAKSGTSDDGARYLEEAVATGAPAVLSSFFHPFLKGVTQLITEDVRTVEGLLAARFYQNPSQALFTVGITGTNGKTTTTYLIKHLLDYVGIPCGLIGTIEYLIGTTRFPSSLTTPDIITTQKLLREMVKQQCGAAAMEVSSIGLVQRRVEGIDYDVAIFSNLTPEHLDYHKTMEEYAAAKELLFRSLRPDAHALFNEDSPWSAQMRRSTRAIPMTYGFSERADLRAHGVKRYATHTEFLLSFGGETVSCAWKLLGQFNIYNGLAAVGALLCKGISLQKIPEALTTFAAVPGRMEPVPNKRGVHIYVDYAHTPDALEKSLSVFQDIGRGKLILVFGCGGERDRQKRPLMAQVAEKYSDRVIVTSDNPRTENPEAIFADIVQGFTASSTHILERDRRKAIVCALAEAGPDDVILIAGKGHETYQIFAHSTLPFDDRQVAYTLANP